MRFFCFLFLALLAFGLVACQLSPFPSAEQPVSSQDTPQPVEIPAEGQYEIGEAAMVAMVDAVILESWPLQVQARITGNLPDGCTTIQRTESRLEGARFIITIHTQRDREAFCTQALVPFEETHPLNVYGLPAGTYSMDAYGVTADFTFERDNIIQGPSGG